MNHSRYFRLAALFLALSLMLGACGGAKPVSTEAETTPAATEAPTTEEPTTEEPTTEEPTTEEPTTEEPTTEEPTEPEPDPITIERATIVDKEKIRIIVEDFYDTETATNMNLIVGNYSDKPVTVYYSSLMVNGYTVPEPDAIKVPAGRVVYTKLSVDRALLEDLGITEIGSVVADYNVINTETGASILNPDPYEIKTSVYETFADAKEWTGPELYNDKDVVIRLEDVVPTETGAAAVKLYLENNSKKDIIFISEYTYVNGRKVEAPFLYAVKASSKALATLTVSRTAMDTCAVGDTVDSLELFLKARDGASWEVLFETGGMFCDLSGSLPVFDAEGTEGDTDFLPIKLILDEEDIMVATRGFVDSPEHGPGLKLQIGNNSQTPVRFSVDCAVVDDYVMNGCGLIVPVDAGTVVDAVLYFDLKTVRLIGAEEIGTVVLHCSLQDGETHKVLKAFDPLTVETAAKERVKIVEEKKGLEIYNEKKLHLVVVASSFSENLGARLYVWAKNTSDKTMVLEPINVKLNKVGLLGLGSITVLPGKMTIASYIIPPREVTSHGLTELTSLILNTNVYDDAGKLQFMTLYGGFEEK